ncbi:MAG: hypothetical protein PUK83_05770 [Clostridia bacterium]|nr:hypothetical protein [Clostridia bacterium]MDY5263997.1 hypothetical protein [Eubacteriales bacterium]
MSELERLIKKYNITNKDLIECLDISMAEFEIWYEDYIYCVHHYNDKYYVSTSEGEEFEYNMLDDVFDNLVLCDGTPFLEALDKNLIGDFDF